MEDPLLKTGEKATDSDDDSSVPEAGSQHKTPDAVATSLELLTETPAKAMLASLTKQVGRQGCQWAEDQLQMSELCRQVIDTSNQLTSLCIAVERLFKAQAATRAYPLVMSKSTTNMAATTGTADKPSGYSRSSHDTNQQFPYMFVSTALLDHQSLSTLGGCNGPGGSATLFPDFYRHPTAWQGAPPAAAPLTIPNQPPHDTTASLRTTATQTTGHLWIN